MYYVAKTMEIAGAHSLHLSYESKCENYMAITGLLRFIVKRKN